MDQFNFPRQRQTPYTSSNNNLMKLPSNYQQAFDNVGEAKNLINSRLEKLNYEKSIINGITSPYGGAANFDIRLPRIQNRHNNMLNVNLIKSTHNRREILGNHNNYNQYPIDPIYFPMEMPMNAEPVNLPKIELGQPLNEYEEPLEPADVSLCRI